MRNYRSFILRTLAVAGLAVALSAGAARAATIYIATNGDDGAAGTEQAPLRTPQSGIDKARPGDTVFVKQGVYRWQLFFPRSGTKDNPITLTGEPGAIIDGGMLLTGWEKVPGPGNVYRAPYTGELPRNLTMNNKYILRIRDDIMVSAEGMTLLTEGSKLHRGTGRSWEGIGAFWGTKNGYVYLGLQDATVDPTKQEITIAQHGRHGGYGICIDGVRFITVRGLTVRNGYYAIMTRGQASDCIIEKNTVIGGKHMIEVTEGSSHITVRNNEVTLGYSHTLEPSDPVHWNIWDAFKGVSDADRVCIEFSNVGSDNEAYGNHCFESFDGIENGGTGKNLDVHDNVVEIMADDGLETDGEETNARWHDNLVMRSNITYRHKDITGPGPMYVYRNRFYSLPGGDNTSGYGIYFFAGITTPCYIYQNTFVNSIGLCFGGTNMRVGLDNTWIVNNVFSSTQVFKQSELWTSARPHLIGNYISGELGALPEWCGTTNKYVQKGTLWDQTKTPDFKLAADSPAREIGLDLSKANEIAGKTLPVLDGMTAGYFSGARPDAGAVQFGKADAVKVAVPVPDK